MTNRIFTLLILLFFLPPFAYADTLGSTKISYSTGERSQTDAIEERDLSGSYTFHKYSIAVKAEPLEDFYYRAGAKYYKKDFDSKRNNMDNKTGLYDLSFSLPLYKAEESLISLKGDCGLLNKRYENSPSSEYDKNSLSSGLVLDLYKRYSLKLLGGIKDYDYIKDASSDILKSFIKIASSVKSSDGRFDLSGHYKRDWADQAENKKDYTEDTFFFKTLLKLKMPLIYKLGIHFGTGRNDTRDSDEDREDNLRFSYRLWGVRTYHEFNKTVETKISYSQAERKYLTSINSYDNWSLKDETKFRILKDKPFDLDLLIGGGHKETTFYENESLSYKKNSLSAGLNISERADWSFKPAFSFSKYKYLPGSTSNQKSYKLKLNLKKYIGSTDKALEAGYWHKWKDYKYKPDVEQWALNLNFTLKF
ncbi:MAG: hypothetical protein HQ572_03520 [Candidatus Omnitrophica bacterium]|nr:hypothetical protein [Candidatus Omnitrophota bacterium]